FSSMADKWGRNPVMALTILCYSVFSGITAFATEAWQVGVLRFFVAMGVGRGRGAGGGGLSKAGAGARRRNFPCQQCHGLVACRRRGSLRGSQLENRL